MDRNSLVLIILLNLCLLVFQACSQESTDLPEEGLVRYLPQSGEAGTWERGDVPQPYKGETLYDYINGGAEIYYEYGFEEVIVQDYKNPSGKEITLEIFKMRNHKGAYGIYTFKRSVRGKEVSFGNEGQIEDYYLNFWKDDFVVTLTGFDEEEETVDGLSEIARAVDARMESGGETPALISLVPQEGLVKQSIKYLKGNIGLYNCYMFSSKNIFKFREGVKADFEAGYQVYILGYLNNVDCRQRFNEVQVRLQEIDKYGDFKIVDNGFRFSDEKDAVIFIMPIDEYMLIVLGAISQDISKKVLAEFQNHIDRH